MKLPNSALAIVDIPELRAYWLNPRHARGGNKVRVFASVGILEANAEELRTALFAAAGNGAARLGVVNSYGQRYIVDFELVRENPKHMDRANRRGLAAADELLSTITLDLY